MPGAFADLSNDALVRWIEDSLAAGSHRLARGYQGQALLYQDDIRRLVIKVPSGTGLTRWIQTLMLRHEARVYERLRDVPGVPRYYGLLRDRYLVLEFVDGRNAREVELADRAAFFAELLELVKALHARGIAHSDLQKKDNLLVIDDRHPCLLDFGAAVIRRDGFAPFNHLHFRVARRLDLNQWVKLKYQGRFDIASSADLTLYRRTYLERVARRVKRGYRRIRRSLIGRGRPVR